MKWMVLTQEMSSTQYQGVMGLSTHYSLQYVIVSYDKLILGTKIQFMLRSNWTDMTSTDNQYVYFDGDVSCPRLPLASDENARFPV